MDEFIVFSTIPTYSSIPHESAKTTEDFPMDTALRLRGFRSSPAAPAFLLIVPGMAPIFEAMTWKKRSSMSHQTTGENIIQSSQMIYNQICMYIYI